MIAVPPNDDALIQSYGKRAVLFAQTGQTEQAIEALEEAVTRTADAGGPPRISDLSLINNLAVLYRRVGRDEDALGRYEQGLRISEEILSPDHPVTLLARSNRAVILQRLGRLDEAETELRDVLEMQSTILGEQHDSTLTTTFNLAKLLVDREDLASAEPLYRAAIEGNRATFGESHPNVGMSLGGLGMAIGKLGGPERADEAIRLLEQSVAILRRTLGPEHGATVSTQRELDALGGSPDEPAGADPATGTPRRTPTGTRSRP